WYLEKTPSICPGCSTGCNISVETYQNRIARFKPRVNEAVNSHWICDEGRYCFHGLTDGERLTTPLIRQEGGLVATTWEQALQAVGTGLKSAGPVAAILSGRNTNEEAYLFAKLAKRISSGCDLEVFYQERMLTEVQKILMSPDRSPNFRGAREMGVSSNGGFDPLMKKIIAGGFSAAYVVGDDLITTSSEPDLVRAALQKLSFLVVQDTRLTETAKLAHVVLPATHFGEKEGTYTNRKGRVQKINAALVAPEGALQDSDIFLRLLDQIGETQNYFTPAEIFAALAREIPSYRGIEYELIGDQGIELGSGSAGIT
ncbi:MAG TPA: molybdopterin-dependent oxidoreductase, partial [Candidatus Binatia bacterium]|nr:molybdopterin-dependent oxidoreductase [Candidatus Binatia bacterium]